MSWADKALKKHRVEKMTMDIINSRKYQEAKKADMEQAALNAYCRFVLVACDYLQIKYRCKKKGIENFLKYATDVMRYTAEDDQYFEDMNQVMIDECGIDVMDVLGLKAVKDDDNT